MITDKFPRWGEPCSHAWLKKVKHWFYKYQCKECGKRLTYKPTNDFWEVTIDKH